MRPLATLLGFFLAAGSRAGEWSPPAAAALVNAARAAVSPLSRDDDERAAFLADAAVSRLPGNFHEVAAGIYRSARPRATDYAGLRDLGIRWILNLEGEGAATSERKAIAALEGPNPDPKTHLTVINVPLSGLSQPPFARVDAALAVLLDPAQRPILVHCKHGQDRTGVIVAAYRVTAESPTRKDPAWAAREAKGLHCCHLVLDVNRLTDYLSDYLAHRARP